MKTFFIKLPIWPIIFMLFGCVSKEVTVESRNAREYMTQDLEDEIMFNLIRARNGMPFAHYDVQNIQAVVTSKVIPLVSAGRTATNFSLPHIHTVQQTVPGSTVITDTLGSASSAVQTIARPLGASLSDERDNAVTVVINPIFDDPTIYKAYVDFLSYKKPDTLKAKPTATPTPPPTEIDNYDAQATDPLGRPLYYNTKDHTFTNDPTKADPNQGWVPLRTSTTLTVTSIPPPKDTPLVLKSFDKDVRTVAKRPQRPLEDEYIPHTLKYWEGDYYWIPIDYREQYSKLWLALIARKSPSAGAGGGNAGISIGQKQLKALQQQNLNTTNQGILGM